MLFCLLELLLTETLALDDLVVTHVVIEWVTTLTEIVQYIGGVQEGHPGTVIPAHPQQGVFCQRNHHQRFIDFIIYSLPYFD